LERSAVQEIRAHLSSASPERLPRLIASYKDDSRTGVRSAVEAARRRLTAHRAEERRLTGLASAEAELYAGGCVCVAGVDEVGRGALAGPLTAGAVVLRPGTRIPGLDDSKRIKPDRRVEIAHEIRAVAVTWHVAHVEAADLDALGMTAALRRAMHEALAGLTPAADHALVDGLPMRLSLPETAIVQGDSKVAAIAAASILAKVTRDALMRELDAMHPGYEFAINKGYGTPEHKAAIDRLGLSPVHRRSFSPCGGTLPLF